MKLFTRVLAMFLSIVMLSLTALAANSAEKLSEEETAMLVTAVKEQADQAVKYDSQCTLWKGNTYGDCAKEDIRIECKAITDEQNLYWFIFSTNSSVPDVMVNVNIGGCIYEFTYGADVLVYDKANSKLYLVQEAFDKGMITEEQLVSELGANLLGDSNLDGKLDIQDVVNMRQLIIQDMYYGISTDLNKDSFIDVLDLVLLRDKIINDK